MPIKVISGTALHTPTRGRLEVLENVHILVDETGRISEILPSDHPRLAEVRAHAEAQGNLTELQQGQFLLPGFVDLHIHAPQWPQLGKALDASLEVWLQKYTFPLEARYSDLAFAREVYEGLVEALLANGTTTAVYFATIHLEASLALAEICLTKGQRALVGKVAMDDTGQCPDFYRDADASTAVNETRAFIQGVRELAGCEDPLVRPVITPRFIPSCTDSLLEGLGNLAEQMDCLVQTHCSESDWESRFVQERFGASDTAVLSRFGLLRQNTILAHSNFVSDEDLTAIQHKGAAIAHCPLSNFYFANAVFPLRAALDKNVHVGLGSDISAGHSPSILDGCRHALLASRARQSGIDPRLPPDERGISGSAVSIPEAFWLATAGGGEALGLPIGKFVLGYKFDALVLDLNTPGSNVGWFPNLDTLEDLFQKLVLNATRSNIVMVWVDGAIVARSPSIHL
ncbi:guanine deaminase [Microvirga makkahensis]|uniref:Guanine deaminase n=1 Tax=Microvirga makkahensis TaxID=1128670 RepID=A0A7X3MVP5_9HYPH|nr:guanine deaminase [Microvirga makkahensis]MXQ14041.1 guanine deaminase [Microvirga makkahensis]